MRMEHQAKLSGVAGGMGSGLLLATFIDVATDGFIIGAGFAAGGQTGTILALGLSVELLFLGLALATGSVWWLPGLLEHPTHRSMNGRIAGITAAPA